MTCRWPLRPAWPRPARTSVKDPNAAFKYTARGNLVGVVTNGTAVLGLGDIGPLAGKPVMEGKGRACSRSSRASTCSTSRSTRKTREARRDHRQPGAHLRRHQPGRHQGAGLLLHRAQAARAHEDSGLSRRSARHGHRRPALPSQRPEGGGQGHRDSPGSWPRARAPRRWPAWACW